MVKRKEPIEPEAGLPKLRIPREQAATQIAERIQKGEELLCATIASPAALDKLRNDWGAWHDYNIDYLKKIFTNSNPADQYRRHARFSSPMNDFREEVDDEKRDITFHVERLKSLLGRLDLIDCVNDNEISTATAMPMAVGRCIFLVHGHAETTRLKVDRFLRQLALDVTVLHEKPNEGRWLMDKFAHNAEQADFAVILLTADDEGRKRGAEVLNPRARQNVIWEFGYFVAKLGLKRVVALRDEQIENPSDIEGLTYISLRCEEWKLLLAREIKAAGISIDQNMLFDA